MSFLQIFSVASKIEKLKTSGNIKGLIQLLIHKKRLIREAAVRALIEIGKPAVEPLLDELSSGGIYARAFSDDQKATLMEGVAQALGEIGDPSAVPFLAAAADDKWYPYKIKPALLALRKIGNPAVVTLEKMLNDDTCTFMYSGARWDTIRIHRMIICVLGEIGNDRAVEPLLSTLKTHESSEVRKQAAEALEKIGGKEVRAVLAKIDWRDDPRSIEQLIEGLKDLSSQKRKDAAQSLAHKKWKPKSADEQALVAIAHKDWDQCVRIGVPTVEHLARFIITDERMTSRDILNTLARIHDPRTVDALITTLNEIMSREDIVLNNSLQEIRGWTIDALGELGDRKAVDVLLTAGKSGASVEALRALTRMKVNSDKAIDYYCYALRYSDKESVMAAIRAVREIPTRLAIEPLEVLVKDRDRDSDIRSAAQEALDKIQAAEEKRSAAVQALRCSVCGKTSDELMAVYQQKNPNVAIIDRTWVGQCPDCGKVFCVMCAAKVPDDVYKNELVPGCPEHKVLLKFARY